MSRLVANRQVDWYIAYGLPCLLPSVRQMYFSQSISVNLAENVATDLLTTAYWSVCLCMTPAVKQLFQDTNVTYVMVNIILELHWDMFIYTEE